SGQGTPSIYARLKFEMLSSPYGDASPVHNLGGASNDVPALVKGPLKGDDGFQEVFNEIFSGTSSTPVSFRYVNATVHLIARVPGQARLGLVCDGSAHGFGVEFFDVSDHDNRCIGTASGYEDIVIYSPDSDGDGLTDYDEQ